MDVFSNLILGFSVALSPINLLYAMIGCVLGTLIGVLPGVGPVATLSMLLPTTYALPPVSALIMLAGLYYGSQYGSSTTSILVNLPGEPSSVVTMLDGYQMALKGQAGPALAVAALGSFFAGTVGTLLIALFATPMTDMALKFGPAEYVSLMILGLVGAVVLAHGSVVKALAMIVLGLVLGLVGTDVNSGVIRFSAGIPELSDGIGFVVIAMGMFGFGEVTLNLERKEHRSTGKKEPLRLWLTREEIRRVIPAVLRGTVVGSLLGVLPGGGPTIAAFSAYVLEKKVSRTPERFGKGAIEGVAAPESANNAGAQTSFIPMLTLGIPTTATLALMMGAMMIYNIQPGPQVMTTNPDLFWGLIASMWVGNLMLLVLNLPLIRIWVVLLTIPYRMLYPAILVFCCIGAYSLNNNVFDVMMTGLFGLLGYVFGKLECEPAPLLLGYILGPLMEEFFRRALLLSHGDFLVFVASPISCILLGLTALLLFVMFLPVISKKRDVVFEDN